MTRRVIGTARACVLAVDLPDHTRGGDIGNTVTTTAGTPAETRRPRRLATTAGDTGAADTDADQTIGQVQPGEGRPA